MSDRSYIVAGLYTSAKGFSFAGTSGANSMLKTRKGDGVEVFCTVANFDVGTRYSANFVRLPEVMDRETALRHLLTRSEFNEDEKKYIAAEIDSIEKAAAAAQAAAEKKAAKKATAEKPAETTEPKADKKASKKLRDAIAPEQQATSPA